MAHQEWEHLFSVKLSAGILPTKVNMVQRKHSDNPRCPCCDKEENADHILQCTSTLQGEVYRTEEEALDDTSWEIRGALLELIAAFRERREPNTHHNWSNSTCAMVMSQFDLGQPAFLSGLWTK